MKKKFFFSVLCLTVLSACDFFDKFSRITHPNRTSVRFVSEQRGASIANVAIGGILVYAIRSDGYREAVKLDHEGDAREFSLPNGQYKFVAVGWDAANLGGTTRCGNATNPGNGSELFELNGSALTVPITISNANCDSDSFAAVGFRNTSTFANLEFVFCGGSVDMSGFTSATTCGAGKESYRFFIGNQSGGVGADHAGISGDGSRFVYMADPHEDNRMELFSVNFSGTGTVKLNPALATGGYVLEFEAVPNSNKIVYLAKQDNPAVPELYLATIGQPGSTKISGTVETLSATWGVKTFRISPDGRWVIFVGKMENTPGVAELYSVDLQTTGYPRANLNTAPADGIYESPPSSGHWIFDIAKTPPYKVLFAANLAPNAPGINHLYTVNPDNSMFTQISSAACGNVTAMEVQEALFNYNGSKVLWRQDCANDNIMEAFVAPSTGGTSYEIHDSTSIQNGTGRLFVSPLADIAVFTADESAQTDMMDIYSVDFATLTQAAIDSSRTKLFDETGTTGLHVDRLEFSPDGGKIIYIKDTSGPMYKLFGATIGAADSHTLLSGSTFQTPGFPAGGGGGPDRRFFFANNNDIYYLTDSASHSGKNAFFKSPINAAGTMVGLDPTVQTNSLSTVMMATLAPNGKVFYTMDVNAVGQYEVIQYDPSGPANTNRNYSSYIPSIFEMHFPEPDEPSIGGFTNGAVLTGQHDMTTTHRDMWLLRDYTAATPEFVKLTRNWNGGTLGRFKLVLLRYKSDPAGNLMESATGLESLCITPSMGTDGAPNPIGSVKIPAGPVGAANPFVLAIDIYPEASGCTGTPSRILLPRGLANHTIGPNAAQVKAFGSGSTARIFIRD